MGSISHINVYTKSNDSLVISISNNKEVFVWYLLT